MNGALIIDKPRGITSHDAVQAVRRMLGLRRAGHLGTLDPLATGVLVVLLGAATRLATFYSNREKVYEAVIRLGFSTDTYDSTGSATSADQKSEIDEPNLKAILSEYLGTIEQQPPIFSAKKVLGVPAYRLARNGLSVTLKKTMVTIHELRLISYDGSFVRLHTRVSSGTYIRSLAHDIGQRVGVGAHLIELRRTAVGEFNFSQAITLDELQKQVVAGMVSIIPPERLLPEIPAVLLEESSALAVAHGINLEVRLNSPQIRLLQPSGRLLGIANRCEEGVYHPAVVFPG